MANQFFVPFNFDPFSIDLKTAAYTIPTGYYAKMRVLNSIAVNFTTGTLSGGLLVDGNLYYPWLNAVCDNTLSGGVTLTTEVSGHVRFYHSGTSWITRRYYSVSSYQENSTLGTYDGAATEGSIDFSSATIHMTSQYLHKGDSFRTNSNGQFARVSIVPDVAPQREFWLNEGAEVTFSTGTSFEYVIELYTKIS